MTQDIEEKLRLIPDAPGIYKFLSSKKQIIYIGKAKSLKKRVRGYFVDSNQADHRIINLVPHITDIEWIIVRTEAEALILEDQLIKTHHPKYNIQLKDDKSYPYFKLSLGEKFPRLTLVREIKKDGSVYFGPYVAVSQARVVKKVIARYFPLRQSKFHIDGSKVHKPCLNFHLKRCLAPCAGKVTRAEYGKVVKQVRQLLLGSYDELRKSLKSEMKLLSESMEFEEAAKLRDRINALTGTFQKQRIVSKHKIDRDVLALVRSGGFANVQVLFIRGGVLFSDDSFFFQRADQFNDQELIRSTLSKLYVSGAKPLPKEILLSLEYDGASMLEDYLSSHRNEVVKIIVPRRGEKKDLINIAQKNGKQSLAVHMNTIRSDEMVLKEVKQKLHLRNLPISVECFDISHISGTNNVASMVVWQNNRSLKKNYRKYKIRTLDGANDYAAMEEVLDRRYKRMIKEEQDLPDLIIIDGGKGQLASAIKVFEHLGVDINQVDVIGLAKGRTEKRAGVEKGAEDYEYVVKPKRKNEINLRKNSSTLHFLQNIRDEAHRFAIGYHRKIRAKNSIKSILEYIPGIGAQKRKILLKHFGSVKNIRSSTVEELEAVDGISSQNAQDIINHFHSR